MKASHNGFFATVSNGSFYISHPKAFLQCLVFCVQVFIFFSFSQMRKMTVVARTDWFPFDLGDATKANVGSWHEKGGKGRKRWCLGFLSDIIRGGGGGRAGGGGFKKNLDRSRDPNPERPFVSGMEAGTQVSSEIATIDSWFWSYTCWYFAFKVFIIVVAFFPFLSISCFCYAILQSFFLKHFWCHRPCRMTRIEQEMQMYMQE